MALSLIYHPFSSYSWKALIALYEAGTPFTPLSLEHAENGATLGKLWPMGKFPVLVDDARGVTLPESSVIIEHLDTYYPGPTPLLPKDTDTRLQVRLMDRVFDNYIHTPMQQHVSDRLRPTGHNDPHGVAQAGTALDNAYAWLNTYMTNRTWAVGDSFTLADCAAAPALFYADWVRPIGARFPNITAYRARLLARPSVKRAVDDARPWRKLFPGGAPDRD